MKNWFLHILLLAGLFGMLTTSCSQDTEELTEVVVPRNEKLQVYFTLNLGEEGMRSRTWDGYDKDDANANGEEGVGMETAVNDIQVLLFANDNNNTFLGKVSVTMLTPEAASHLYTFYGELPSMPSGYSIMDANNYLNCKLMILANCPEVTGLAPGTSVIASDVLKNITYNFNGSTDEIPMWGVLKAVPADRIKMQEGNYPNPLPDIYLLRAMAKVEVIMQAEDHEITSIAIERYNNTGHCIPTGYASAVNTKTLSRSGSFNATTSVNTGEISFINNVSEVTIDGEAYNCYTIYVPEYMNMNDEGTTAVSNPSRIAIQVDKKTTKTYYVHYGSAGKETEWNIVRNHIYRYNITAVKDGVSLELTCQVQPWNLVEQVIDYKSEPSAADGGQISWIKGTLSGSEVTLDKSNLTAECTFTLQSPLGYQWLATLVPVGDGASAANTPFGFIVDGEDVGLDTSGVIDGNQVTLTIKSDAVDGVDEDQKVRLQIMVIKGDGTSVILDEDIIGGIYTIIHAK